MHAFTTRHSMAHRRAYANRMSAITLISGGMMVVMVACSGQSGQSGVPTTNATRGNSATTAVTPSTMPSSTDATTSAAPIAASGALDVCTLMPASAINTAAKTNYQASKSVNDASVNQYGCEYSPGPIASVNVVTGGAAESFAHLKTLATDAVAVSGLGDQAFYSADLGLNVLRGDEGINVFIQMPDAQATDTQLAESLIAKL